MYTGKSVKDNKVDVVPVFFPSLFLDLFSDHSSDQLATPTPKTTIVTG
jgi:hypothetical protein